MSTPDPHSRIRDRELIRLLGWWEDDVVDHVDDPIGAHDVCFYHLCGAVESERLTLDRQSDVLLVQGGSLAQRDGCLGLDLSGDDMVRQDGDKLILVFRLEECLDRSFRELGEGLISWGKDREWTFALHGFDQIGSSEGCGESFKGAGGDGGVDDVFLSSLVMICRGS